MSDGTIFAALQANGILQRGPSGALYLELLTGGFWNRVYRLRSKKDTAID